MVKAKDWTGNAKSIFTCNGASNHSEEERQIDDYYATEPKASAAERPITRPFLHFLNAFLLIL